jgi:hypothetical protein
MEVTGLPRLLQDAGAACSKTAPITQRLGPQLFPKKKAPTREISRGQLDHGWMRPTRVVKKFIADSLGSPPSFAVLGHAAKVAGATTLGRRGAEPAHPAAGIVVLMELRPAPELPQARRGPLHPSIKRPLRLWNAILNCHARGPRGTPALGRDFRGWSGSGVIVAEAMGGDAGAAFRPGQVRQLICAASSRVTCRRNIGFTAECYSDC